MTWRKKFNIDNKGPDDLRPGQRLVVYYSLMSWFIIMGILIFFIGIVMATGIVHSVEGIQEFKCLKYSDGTIAILDTILDTSCVNREDLYKEIEWFLDKGYTLDAIININNEGALPQYEVEVWMTR
jgi:hypothetical protein